MWLWKQRLKPLAEFQIIFLTCKIRGCAVNLNYDTAPYFHHHFILYAALRGLFFPITTFWAYSIRIEGDTAKRTAVDVILCGKLGRRGIHTACESDFSDVQFVFQQVIYNLNHTFHCHGFFGNNQTGIGVSRCQFGLEGLSFHFVLRMAVFDALLFIHIKNGRKQRVIFAEHQGMVKILQQAPCHLLDFITRVHHVYTFFNRIFHLNGQCASVTVKILGFALEAIEPMCILQIESRDTSHTFYFLEFNFGLFIVICTCIRLMSTDAKFFSFKYCRINSVSPSSI